MSAIINAKVVFDLTGKPILARAVIGLDLVVIIMGKQTSAIPLQQGASYHLLLELRGDPGCAASMKFLDENDKVIKVVPLLPDGTTKPPVDDLECATTGTLWHDAKAGEMTVP